MKLPRLLSIGSLLLPLVANAQPALPSGATQPPPPVACGNLPGCGLGWASLLPVAEGIAYITDKFLQITAALAVISIVWAGYQLVFSNGEDGASEKAKNTILYGLGGLALALSANALVSFVVSTNWGQASGSPSVINPTFFIGVDDFLFGQLGIFGSIVRIALALFNVILLFVILYAGYLMVMGRGKSDQTQKGVKILKWAIIGAILVNVSRALVNIFLRLPWLG